MSSRLTLHMNEDLIEFGKRWARNHGKSLSTLLSDYLVTLEKLPADEEELPPTTRKLLGIAKNVDEEDYRRYLETKHG